MNIHKKLKALRGYGEERRQKTIALRPLEISYFKLDCLNNILKI
jgi:hypothetical protein